MLSGVKRIGTRFRAIRGFLFNLTWIIAFVVTSIYLGISYRNNELVRENAVEQARSTVDLVIAAREWNARSGGTLVEQRPGVEVNPYLVEMGFQSQISTADGRVFVFRNPAMMTREISEIAKEYGLANFRLTSDRPINENNRPDEFELDALHQFKQGKREVWTIDRSGETPQLRYVRPVFVEKSCLECHSHHGYKLDDIRGGISVTIPYDEVDTQLVVNSVIVVGLMVATIVLLLGSIYLLGSRLIGRLEEAENELHRLTITDDLTGLNNRRHVMKRLDEEFHRSRRFGESLGIIMVDLDHFKAINDAYGHLEGDVVLRSTALQILDGIRQYDVCGRFGGEEFLIICPNITEDQIIMVAKRIQQLVKSQVLGTPTNPLVVTASLGVALLAPADTSPQAIVARADLALYKAKAHGRDRVVSFHERIEVDNQALAG